ncbi:chemotaxis protein CheB [Jannaschia formosa]|uniref:chemotaxis protein CheB n=1 Tax=Jannaschia formosa TaxID=2259592 RepID=UPI000E1C3616|nr:chemotaxis protein CheB [Jannaschia formosa]TFL16838.1 PAS domain S-box protein [Jannaschia formosa]
MVEVDKEARKRQEPLTPICAIGTSAGGVQALQKFFERIEGDLGLAYVVIMHLSPDHESQMSEILAGRTKMPVRQVDDTPKLEPNCVYVIAPDRELVIEGNNVHSRPFTEPRHMRASIDMFFRSVAAGRGDGLAVVLTGAGSDGAMGVRKMKEAGGVIFVQDPAEAEYGMMPRSAIATGVADFIEPLERLIDRIAEVARSKTALRRLDDDEAEVQVRQIIAFLHARTGHDFSSYKRATVLRRITRRMQVTRQTSLAAYAQYLRENPEEAQDLFGDLLISVTAFFRDPGAFESLVEQAIAPLFRNLNADEKIRIWSAGCATGEEAYTLAMLAVEEAERQREVPAIQIFATDLDDGALATAREGRYPKAIEADVSEDRLKRFFIDEGTHYRIRQEIRDLVLFARHSALKDPPFINLDLIVCRNLLIYLERELQRQLLALFHYALKPGRYLFLGSAESVDMKPELFTACDREARVYTAKLMSGRHADLLTQLPREQRPPMPGGRKHEPEQPPKAPSSVHATALEEFAPPSALVDEEHRIVNLSKTAGHFIRPPEGPLSSELPVLVRPELRSELSRALHRAFAADETTLSLPVSVGFNGSRRRVVLHVQPVASQRSPGRHALVLFIDGGAASAEGLPVETSGDTGDAERVRKLAEELKTTQERLSASRREHEASIQELRIANEELQSINEEYRSTAEELETSKEELQSINEELSTVNSELKGKLDAIASAHSDLQNLINATEIGTLFLDPKLRIKMLTPAVEQLFSVTDSDVGRPITDFTHKLAYDGVEKDAAKVLRELTPVETEVETRDGRWLMMRLRPYRTVEDKIEGVVLSFVDISARREAEGRLRESEARYRRLFDSMDEGYLLAEVIRDEAGEAIDIHYADANPAAIRMVHADLTGRRMSEISNDFEPHWRTVPAQVLESGEPAHAELFAQQLGSWFEINVTKVDARQVAILFQDITERKRHERERELMMGELNHRVKNMLAVVQSIANQTLRSTPEPAKFTAAFGERVRALGRAHALLTEQHWRGTDLRKLAEALLGSFTDADAKLRIEGPRVRLAPVAAIPMSMALHELATNAVKYGAFSVPAGTILLTWELEGKGRDRQLQVIWKEQGGPTVAPPTREGFGRRMLERGIAHELDGNVDLDYAPAGVICRMSLPAENALADED